MRRTLPLLVLLALTGCLSFRELPPQSSGEQGALPSTVRVVRVDGTSQLLGNARQVGDTLRGVWPTSATRYAIPVSDVARIEARRFDRRRTAILVGSVLGAAGLLWAWYELSFEEVYAGAP